MAEEVINIEILFAEPILIEMAIDNGYNIIPSAVPGSEPLFTGSEAFKLTTGDKLFINEINQVPDLALLFENNLI